MSHDRLKLTESSIHRRWREAGFRYASCYLTYKRIFDTCSVDVLKALCLGAKAVGLGRPFLYAQSVSCLSYGNSIGFADIQ